MGMNVIEQNEARQAAFDAMLEALDAAAYYLCFGPAGALKTKTMKQITAAIGRAEKVMGQ